MRLYKLTQTVNLGFDTIRSCIVAAESEHVACRISPVDDDRIPFQWAEPHDVEVQLIGTANPGAECPGVICVEFNQE